MNTFKRVFLSFIEKIIPNKNISSSKKLWNKLANENYRYYIVSKKGKGIDSEEFKKTGLKNYNDIIRNDVFLLDNLNPYNEKRVLEIGCGIGRMTEFFGNDFESVYGIDISEKMIEEGKKYLAHLSSNKIHLMATDGVSYPFEDNFFDFIFSYIVFQHMPNKEVVKKNLEEVLRVLNPNGIAKIQLRGGSQPHKWNWYYGPSFSLNEATEMINKIGLKILKTEGENTKRFWFWLKK